MSTILIIWITVIIQLESLNLELELIICLWNWNWSNQIEGNWNWLVVDDPIVRCITGCDFVMKELGRVHDALIFELVNKLMYKIIECWWSLVCSRWINKAKFILFCKGHQPCHYISTQFKRLVRENFLSQILTCKQLKTTNLE